MISMLFSVAGQLSMEVPRSTLSRKASKKQRAAFLASSPQNLLSYSSISEQLRCQWESIILL